MFGRSGIGRSGKGGNRFDRSIFAVRAVQPARGWPAKGSAIRRGWLTMDLKGPGRESTTLGPPAQQLHKPSGPPSGKGVSGKGIEDGSGRRRLFTSLTLTVGLANVQPCRLGPSGGPRRSDRNGLTKKHTKDDIGAARMISRFLARRHPMARAVYVETIRPKTDHHQPSPVVNELRPEKRPNIFGFLRVGRLYSRVADRRGPIS